MHTTRGSSAAMASSMPAAARGGLGCLLDVFSTDGELGRAVKGDRTGRRLQTLLRRSP